MRLIERRCENLKAEEKRKCIVIRGLQKDRRGFEKEMEEFFDTKLEREVKVQQASILGQERKVIWVKFGTLEDKDKIMEWKKRLGQEPIYKEKSYRRKGKRMKKEL